MLPSRQRRSGKIIMTGRATQKGEHEGVTFAAQLQIIADGGNLTQSDGGLDVKDASAATIYVVAASNYRGDDPRGVCEKQLAAAVGKSFQKLQQDHVAEHRRLFRRVELNLGEMEKSSLPTDERLRAVKDGTQDRDLVALYFQFGRYLLLCSSRPGCMPANLQGLWCEHIAAPWNSDYHININIQMNYWPAEVCNLSECHEPFFDLIDNLPAPRPTDRPGRLRLPGLRRALHDRPRGGGPAPWAPWAMACGRSGPRGPASTSGSITPSPRTATSWRREPIRR